MILIGNRYEIVDEIDYLEENKRYEAFDIENREKCFIKIIGNDGYVKKNFLPNLIDESMYIREVGSPYILPIKEVGIYRTGASDMIYIASEHMKGIPFDDMVNGNYIHYDGLVRIAVQISRAIQAYCKNGRYHGSLKTDSIIVDENYNIKIDDFGVTYANNGINIRKGSNVFFLAPSQMSVDLSDIESDFFSIGLILYSAIYKRFPFVKTTNEQMRLKSIDLRINIEAPPLMEKHDRFVLVIDRLLSRNRAEKFRSPLELTRELSEIMYSEISEEFILEEDPIIEAHLDKTGRLSPDIMYKTGKLDANLINLLAEEQRKEREIKKAKKEKLKEEQAQKAKAKEELIQKQNLETERKLKEKLESEKSIEQEIKLEDERQKRERIKLKEDAENFKKKVSQGYDETEYLISNNLTTSDVILKKDKQKRKITKRNREDKNTVDNSVVNNDNLVVDDNKKDQKLEENINELKSLSSNYETPYDDIEYKKNVTNSILFKITAGIVILIIVLTLITYFI